MNYIIKTALIFIAAGCLLVPAYCDEANMETIIKRIAFNISELKKSYDHFSNFDPDSSVYGHTIIYQQGITHVPNPEYEKLTAEQQAVKEKHPGIKQHMISGTVSVFSEKDGIDLRIEFTDMAAKEMSARVDEPYTTMGNWSINVMVHGAKTPLIDEIRESIYQIIHEEKKRFDNSAS